MLAYQMGNSVLYLVTLICYEVHFFTDSECGIIDEAGVITVILVMTEADLHSYTLK